MTLAIDNVDGCGLSIEVHHELLPKKTKVHFTGCTMTIRRITSVIIVGVPSDSEAFKTRLIYSVAVRISAQNNFIPLLKSFFTKVLVYKTEKK